jgi:hypothetical protein
MIRIAEAMENGSTADKGVDVLTDLLIFDSSALGPLESKLHATMVQRSSRSQ